MARSGVMGPKLAVAVLLLAVMGLRVAAEGFPGLQEWTDATLGPNLKKLDPEQWVLLELYSSWCPACRKFQPYYQGAAAALAQEDRLVVARLDCVSNNDECKAYSIRAFPTLYLGRAVDMAGHSVSTLAKLKPVWDTDKFLEAIKEALPKTLAADLKAGNASVAAQKDLGTALGRKGGTDVQAERVNSGSSLTGDTGTGGVDATTLQAQARAMALNDIEGSTLRSWKLIGEAPAALAGPDARQALADWLELLSSGHPLDRCRGGAATILAELPGLWPVEQETPDLKLVELDICPGSKFEVYQGCAAKQGGNADHGFTCGLWQLLHATAAGLGSGPHAGASWLVTVRGFVQHYFMCSECAEHFVAATRGEPAEMVQTRRDAGLWLWRAHNAVNRRLEGEGGAEGAHPQWPSKDLCPKCHDVVGADDSDQGWTENEVLSFLDAVYGPEVHVARGTTAGGSHAKAHATWASAFLVLLVVAAVLGFLLSRSRQYSLIKARTF